MNKNNLPVAVFNGTIATTNGLYRVSDIDIESAKKLVNKYGVISAIGHEATSELMTDLLGVDIPFNRIQFKQEKSQIAIVFKLKERQAEGVVLNVEEIRNIGFSLKLMERLE